MSLRQPISIATPRGHVMTAAPAVEPVAPFTLRQYLRETDEGLPEDEAVSLIEVARQWIEEQTGIAMVSQSWRLSLDRWPNGAEPWWDGVRQGSITELRGNPGWVTLPKWPLQSITSVTVYDEAGTSTAVTVASVFDVDTYQHPGRISVKSGQVWPIAERDINAIQIIYVAGYGAAASAVPATMKRAVMQLAAYLHQHRGDGCDIGDAYAASGAATLAGQYKALRV